MFKLSYFGLGVVRQLRAEAEVLDIRNRGFWRDHYTMTSWAEHAQMRAFARRGYHAELIRRSAEVADLITLYSYETDTRPSWLEARAKVHGQGRELDFRRQRLPRS